MTPRIVNFLTLVYCSLILAYKDFYYTSQYFLLAPLPGNISAHPHTSLCMQFLDKKNNDKEYGFVLGEFDFIRISF